MTEPRSFHSSPPKASDSGIKRWSAPGSLLIAGEYRITENTGMAVALAAGGRARLSSAPAEEYSFYGQWPGTEVSWQPSPGGKKEHLSRSTITPDNDLTAEITATPAAAVWNEFLKSGLKNRLGPPRRLAADTAVFFHNDGTKRGYGSSAAATVLYAAGLMNTVVPDRLKMISLNAHRVFQGGRGSGYDILTSLYGGSGILRGGDSPSWNSFPWPAYFDAWILKGPAPVRSGSAVARYSVWKEANPDAYRSFAENSDSLVGELYKCSSRKFRDMKSNTRCFTESLGELAQLGISLGKAIGVSAVASLSETFETDLTRNKRPGAVIKCLGAGDETILLMAEPGALRTRELRAIDSLVEQGLGEILQMEHHGLREEHS